MLKKIATISLLFSAIILSGCMSTSGGKNLTSVEVQAMQTREFTCTYKTAFASVISVFQDLGFIIQSSDFTTGLIIGTSNIINEPLDFMDSMYDVQMKTAWNTGTAHVEELDENLVSIRVSFVTNKKYSYIYGASKENSAALLNANFYSNFFEKIDKSIFLKQNLRKH